MTKDGAPGALVGSGARAAESYIVRAEGVRKAFGSTEVLTSAGIRARAGEITTLLGRNGSGKTTLLRIVCGQLRPDQGTVWFDGRVQVRPRLASLARQGLMYLPQERIVVPGLTVRRHFDALQEAFGRTVVSDDAVATAVETARLGTLLDQPARHLSGGERMRACLGLALARGPRVLVADEPLVGLSPRDQAFFGDLLRRLAASGTAVVTSGHDTTVLLEISHRIVWSVAGSTTELGTSADARANAQFRREYLGPRGGEPG